MANLTDKLALLITADSTKAVSELKKVGTTADTNLKKAEGAGASFGKSLTSIGSSGFAAVGGVSAVVGVVGSLVSAGREAARNTRLTEAVIKSTGGAAHVSAAQVGELATSISNKTGIDDDAVRSSENLLLTFTNVRNETGKGNDVFNQATVAIQDMSVALGQDAKSSTIQLGKALNDPIKGLTALRRVGVAFTEQQQDQIKTLVKSGDTLTAQKIILGELQKEFGGAAAAAADPIDKLRASFNNLEQEVGGQLLPVVDQYVGIIQQAVNISGTLERATHGSAFSFAGLNHAILATIPGVSLLQSASDTRAAGQKKAADGDKAAAAAVKAVADATQKYTADLASGTATREQLAADSKAVADAQQHQSSIQTAVTNSIQKGTDAANASAAAEKKRDEAEKARLKAAKEAQKQLTDSLTKYGDVAGPVGEKVAKGMGLGKKAIEDLTTVTKSANDGIDKAFNTSSSVIDDWTSKAKFNLKQFEADLLADTVAAANWSTNIATLSKDGIDKGFLQTLIDAGPKSAKVVQGLVDGVRQGSVDTINAIVLAGKAGAQNAKNVVDPALAGIRSSFQDFINYVNTQHPNLDLRISGQPATPTQIHNLALSQHNTGSGPRYGFADGGFVPGPKGAPVPAIVHGGEFVVSNAMLARGVGSSRATVSSAAVNVNIYVTANGAVIPAIVRELRSGTTGLELKRALGV